MVNLWPICGKTQEIYGWSLNSTDWFKGTITGKPYISWENLAGFRLRFSHQPIHWIWEWFPFLWFQWGRCNLPMVRPSRRVRKSLAASSWPWGWHTCVYMCIYTYVYVKLYTEIENMWYMYIYIYIYMYVCLYVYIYIYVMYLYIYIYIYV